MFEGCVKIYLLTAKQASRSALMCQSVVMKTWTMSYKRPKERDWRCKLWKWASETLWSSVIQRRLRIPPQGDSGGYFLWEVLQVFPTGRRPRQRPELTERSLFLNWFRNPSTPPVRLGGLCISAQTAALPPIQLWIRSTKWRAASLFLVGFSLWRFPVFLGIKRNK